ncbi:hypothetical protein LAZ67_3001393 [Cordylochernes scorpioides]|uniref:Uncharacterized protein n=1 Tax=Cordylochernes scorpioides TaxID=51811 RepID=A0ABY6K8H2_9ARAC|nr:hypothetical protein LAZ67_3001393 [Cordylochernes scorpioides]
MMTKHRGAIVLVDDEIAEQFEAVSNIEANAFAADSNMIKGYLLSSINRSGYAFFIFNDYKYMHDTMYNEYGASATANLVENRQRLSINQVTSSNEEVAMKNRLDKAKRLISMIRVGRLSDIVWTDEKIFTAEVTHISQNHR